MFTNYSHGKDAPWILVMSFINREQSNSMVSTHSNVISIIHSGWRAFLQLKFGSRKLSFGFHQTNSFNFSIMFSPVSEQFINQSFATKTWVFLVQKFLIRTAISEQFETLNFFLLAKNSTSFRGECSEASRLGKQFYLNIPIQYDHFGEHFKLTNKN